jgi:hypothetical protein
MEKDFAVLWEESRMVLVVEVGLEVERETF